MVQLESYCAAEPTAQFEWLDSYQGSDINHLNSVNASLASGTSLIADESGLFFFIGTAETVVFSLDDIQEVV